MNIFVIMPFKDEYTALYEDIIERACKDKGLTVGRGDKILEPGNIPQQVLQRIRDAFFIIAEISEDNPNVFYELGYAHSSSKPIIPIADRERKLPFDISGERTIFYDKTKPGWEIKLRNDLDDAINHLFDVSNRLQVDRIKTGAELSGHYHEITGRIIGLEGGEHLWMFIRRDGLGFWSAQNDGEIEVDRNGTWRATMYLGWAHEDEARNNWFDILFGTLNTADNRELTERCIRNQINSDFPPLRRLPQSLEQVFLLRVKRIN
jgi:hypothetical protein